MKAKVSQIENGIKKESMNNSYEICFNTLLCSCIK